MKRMVIMLGAVTVVVAVGVVAAIVTSPQGGTEPTVPGTTVVAARKADPGVEACKASARNQANPAMPTMAQREASWNRYQRSGYPALRDVGVKLEHAWLEGGLSDQIAAGLNLVIECGAYGVDVPVG
jgi:hypothetical protein